MEDGGQIVRSFFERMEARDWKAAAQLLSPSLRIDFTETSEQVIRPNYLAMNSGDRDGVRG